MICEKCPNNIQGVCVTAQKDAEYDRKVLLQCGLAEGEVLPFAEFLSGVKEKIELHEILGDAETMKYCEPAYSLEKTRAFLQSFCIGRRGAVAAVHREQDKVIGYILFNQLETGVYEMGWIFHRRFWGQGYAYEACKAVMEYAFEKLHAHKVFAETIDPVKSAGLMRKLGMRCEGIQRSQTKDLYGNWADLYLYGFLQEERSEL